MDNTCVSPGNSLLYSLILTYIYISPRLSSSNTIRIVIPLYYYQLDIYNPANVDFSDLAPNYCPTDLPVSLSPFPQGGTFSGPGIQTTFSNPRLVTPGSSASIQYAIVDGSCTSSVTHNTFVWNTTPVSIAGLAGSYCLDASPVNITVSRVGGSLVGRGVVLFSSTNNSTNSSMVTPDVYQLQFSPILAGIGNHTIIYTYVDPTTNCPNVFTTHATVYSTQDVDFQGLPPALCINQSPLTLVGSRNTLPGVFEGPSSGLKKSGENSAELDPRLLSGPGVYNITYRVGNGSECADISVTKQVIALECQLLDNIRLYIYIEHI